MTGQTSETNTRNCLETTEAGCMNTSSSAHHAQAQRHIKAGRFSCRKNFERAKVGSSLTNTGLSCPIRLSQLEPPAEVVSERHVEHRSYDKSCPYGGAKQECLHGEVLAFAPEMRDMIGDLDKDSHSPLD